MTGDELRDLIMTCKQALEINRQLIDQQTINLVREFMEELNKQGLPQQYIDNHPVYGAGPDTIINGVKAALDFEEKLIAKPGEVLIKILDHIKDRTLMLGMLARMMS